MTEVSNKAVNKAFIPKSFTGSNEPTEDEIRTHIQKNGESLNAGTFWGLVTAGGSGCLAILLIFMGGNKTLRNGIGVASLTSLAFSGYFYLNRIKVDESIKEKASAPTTNNESNKQTKEPQEEVKPTATNNNPLEENKDLPKPILEEPESNNNQPQPVLQDPKPSPRKHKVQRNPVVNSNDIPDDQPPKAKDRSNLTTLPTPGKKTSVHYTKPFQIGSSNLYIYKYEDLPPSLKETISEQTGFVIVDTSSFDPNAFNKQKVIRPRPDVTVGRNAHQYRPDIKFKGLWNDTKIDISDHIGERFYQHSCQGLGNLLISRSGDEIVFEVLPEKTPPAEDNDKLKYKDRELILKDSRIDEGVYLGAGSEAIVVSFKNDPELRKLYRGCKDYIEKTGAKDEAEILQRIFEYVSSKVKINPDIQSLLESNKWDKDNKVSIDFFIQNGGICRHFGLIYSALIERAIDRGLLKGQVSIDASYIPNSGEGGHAWCRYTNEKEKVWILDGTLGYFGKLDDYQYTDSPSKWVYWREGEGQDDLIKRKNVKSETDKYMQAFLSLHNHLNEIPHILDKKRFKEWTKDFLHLIKEDIYNLKPSALLLLRRLPKESREEINKSLTTLLKSNDTDLAKAAIFLLSCENYEPSIPEMIKLFPNKDLERELVQGLSFMKDKSIPHLIQNLSNPDNHIAGLSMATLSIIGLSSIPHLLDLYTDIKKPPKEVISALLPLELIAKNSPNKDIIIKLILGSLEMMMKKKGLDKKTSEQLYNILESTLTKDNA